MWLELWPGWLRRARLEVVWFGLSLSVGSRCCGTNKVGGPGGSLSVPPRIKVNPIAEGSPIAHR